MASDESTFEQLAKQTLESFMDVIDEELGGYLDVDMNNGILTIELDNGGQYIINKHGSSRQIWMSSPMSGATHFAYDEEGKAWVSTKGEGNLKEILEDELAKATGETFSL